MSRALRLTTVLVALLSVVGTAPRAGAQSYTHIGIAAGPAVPLGDFDTRASTGYDIALSLDVHAPLTPYSFRLEGMYSEFDYASDAGSVGATYRIIARSARVYGISANLTGMLAATRPVTPYVIGGGGFFRRTEPDLSTLSTPGGGGTGVASTRSDNSLGANIGGGFRFELSGFATYIEARYQYIGKSDVRFVPITFGVNF